MRPALGAFVAHPILGGAGRRASRRREKPQRLRLLGCRRLDIDQMRSGRSIRRSVRAAKRGAHERPAAGIQAPVEAGAVRGCRFLAVTLTVGAANTVTVGVASPLWVGSWKTTPSPDQAGSNDILTGAACVPGSTICVAVGHYQSSTDGLQTLVESWSGQHWWLTPSPDEGTNDNLLAVSCFSSSGCMAVGAYTNNSDISRTLIESWNGSSWSIIPSPNQAPGVNDLDNDILTALSCASASSCMAVGSIENGTVLTQPLIERWNGTRWSIIPSPSVGTQDSLSGVSCPSSVYCVAVGSYVDTSTGHDAPLIERWNGSLWSIGPSAQLRDQRLGERLLYEFDQLYGRRDWIYPIWQPVRELEWQRVGDRSRLRRSGLSAEYLLRYFDKLCCREPHRR